MRDLKLSWNQLAIASIFLYITAIILSTSTNHITVMGARVFLFGILSMYWLIVRKGRVCHSVYLEWAILFLLYNAFSCTYAYSRSFAVSNTQSLFYVSIVDILIACYFFEHMDQISLIQNMIIGATLVKCVILFGEGGLFLYLNQRTGLSQNGNTLGFYCAVSAVFSFLQIIQLQRTKRRISSLYVFTGLASIAFLFLSASRKSLVFLALPIIFYYIWKNKNPLHILFAILCVILAALSGYYLIMRIGILYELMGHRVESMISGFQGGKTDASTRTRLALIEFGMKYFRRKPWFGYGTANYRVLADQFRTREIYAHNNYVELLVDGGIVGCSLYYILYLYLLVRGFLHDFRQNTSKTIALGLLLSFIICEYGMVSYYSPVYQLVLLWIYLILMSPEAYLMPAGTGRGRNDIHELDASK